MRFYKGDIVRIQNIFGSYYVDPFKVKRVISHYVEVVMIKDVPGRGDYTITVWSNQVTLMEPRPRRWWHLIADAR